MPITAEALGATPAVFTTSQGMKQESDAAKTTPGPEREASAKDENKQRRSVRRQFLACLAVQMVHIMTGVGMAYSSSLIPALEADSSEVPVTRQQSAWLASTFVLAVPVGSVVSLTVNDCVGRLALVKAMVVPYCVGWVLIATATSFEQVVVGRLCTGLATGLIHSPAVLYITELASKSIRGGLGALSSGMAGLGIVVCYVMGAFLPWRTHAWVNCCVPVLPLTLQFLLSTESPVWLAGRGRGAAAAKASLYYYDDPKMLLSTPSKAGGKKLTLGRQFCLLFSDPLGYKPLLLLNVVFVLQQLVGVYITIYYAVPFLAETGSTIDPYMATILVGVVRLLGCFAVSGILVRCGRRLLMIVSSLGQAVCMAVSGYATLRILQEPGSVSSLWVVGGLLAYIAVGCLGWQTVPWSMMGELFAHEVRSLAQPLNSATAHLLMFAALQLYPSLAALAGNSANVQFVFAAVSALSAAFVFVFLPETCGRTLPEIEEYFRHNVTYLSEKRRRRAAKRLAEKGPVSV